MQGPSLVCLPFGVHSWDHYHGAVCIWLASRPLKVEPVSHDFSHSSWSPPSHGTDFFSVFSARKKGTQLGLARVASNGDEILKSLDFLPLKSLHFWRMYWLNWFDLMKWNWISKTTKFEEKEMHARVLFLSVTTFGETPQLGNQLTTRDLGPKIAKAKLENCLQKILTFQGFCPVIERLHNFCMMADSLDSRYAKLSLTSAMNRSDSFISGMATSDQRLLYRLIPSFKLS